MVHCASLCLLLECRYYNGKSIPGSESAGVLSAQIRSRDESFYPANIAALSSGERTKRITSQSSRLTARYSGTSESRPFQAVTTPYSLYPLTFLSPTDRRVTNQPADDPRCRHETLNTTRATLNAGISGYPTSNGHIEWLFLHSKYRGPEAPDCFEPTPSIMRLPKKPRRSSVAEPVS